MSVATQVPTGAELRGEIDRLRKERNAVILAHYYQKPELQDLADFVGDSLELSRKAADTDADVIAFCGVKFMADTAKILSPRRSSCCRTWKRAARSKTAARRTSSEPSAKPTPTTLR